MKTTNLEILEIEGYPCIIRDFLPSEFHEIYVFSKGVYIVNKGRLDEFKKIMQVISRLSNRRIKKTREKDLEFYNKYKFRENLDLSVWACEAV